VVFLSLLRTDELLGNNLKLATTASFRILIYSPSIIIFAFHSILRGPFERFGDWRQCAAVMQSEAVTVMSSCSGGDNVVVA
jgi:hypothetical protein